MFGVSISRAQDPIKVDLHARWCPDLTVSSPQWQCVDGGSVGGEVEFHFVANYQTGPIQQVNCLKIEIEEQTDVHPPDVRVLELAFSKTLPPPNYPPPNISNFCSKPPTGGYNAYYICATNKEKTLTCHNTAYKVRATYQYIKAGLPPKTIGPLTIEKTFTFNNLTVSSESDTLKWDPNNPANRNNLIKYSITSAQKKYCQVQIKIYDLTGNIVYQKTFSGDEKKVCPGSYTFIWDGTKIEGDSTVRAARGLYAFDIIVNGLDEKGTFLNDDKDTLMSEYLVISDVSAQPSQFCPCFDEKTSISFTLSGSPLNGMVKASFHKAAIKEIVRDIVLTNRVEGINTFQWDGKNNKGIKVKVREKDIDKVLGKRRPSIQEPYHRANYYYVIEAWDTAAALDKAHRNKKALPKGGTLTLYSPIVMGALQQICHPYGCGAGEIVCTHVVYLALKAAGIDLRDKMQPLGLNYLNANDQYLYFRGQGFIVQKPYCYGDVIFMNIDKNGYVHHVGIVTDINENTGEVDKSVHATSNPRIRHTVETKGVPYRKYIIGRHPKE